MLYIFVKNLKDGMTDGMTTVMAKTSWKVIVLAYPRPLTPFSVK